MYKYLFLFSAILFMTSCSSEAQTSEEEVQVTTDEGTQKVINKVVAVSEFKELMKNEEAQLIDIRTDGECARGMIEGAEQIDFRSPDFQANIQKLDKSRPVLVYCASGGRSARAAAMMKGLGFTEVYDLQGGYGAWSRQ